LGHITLGGPVADRPDGLLTQLTKTVLETALDQELTGHLGHEKNGRPDPEAGYVRNGTRSKTADGARTGEDFNA
jgi:putative transposase